MYHINKELFSIHSHLILEMDYSLYLLNISIKWLRLRPCLVCFMLRYKIYKVGLRKVLGFRLSLAYGPYLSMTYVASPTFACKNFVVTFEKAVCSYHFVFLCMLVSIFKLDTINSTSLFCIKSGKYKITSTNVLL